MQNGCLNWSFRDPISRSSARCPSVTVAAAGGCEIARRDEKSVRAARGAHSMIPPICPCRPPTSPVHGMPSIWMGRFVTSEHRSDTVWSLSSSHHGTIGPLTPCIVTINQARLQLLGFVSFQKKWTTFISANLLLLGDS